jgi:hypothetical protein
MPAQQYRSTSFLFLEQILNRAVNSFGEENNQKDQGQSIDDLRKAHKFPPVGNPDILLQSDNQGCC